MPNSAMLGIVCTISEDLKRYSLQRRYPMAQNAKRQPNDDRRRKGSERKKDVLLRLAPEALGARGIFLHERHIAPGA